jgi:hypothetical protein
MGSRKLLQLDKIVVAAAKKFVKVIFAAYKKARANVKDLRSADE